MGQPYFPIDFPLKAEREEIIVMISIPSKKELKEQIHHCSLRWAMLSSKIKEKQRGAPGAPYLFEPLPYASLHRTPFLLARSMGFSLKWNDLVESVCVSFKTQLNLRVRLGLGN